MRSWRDFAPRSVKESRILSVFLQFRKIVAHGRGAEKLFSATLCSSAHGARRPAPGGGTYTQN
jgi:hypothetical protein